MKKILVLIMIFCFFSISSAQFFEVTFDDTSGQFTAPGTFFLAGWLKNITNDPLHIKMIRLENNLPSSNWTSSMCINVCFPDTMDSVSTTMLSNPISPGDSALVDVVFSQSDAIPGTATVLIKFASIHDDQILYQRFEASSVLTGIGESSIDPVNTFKLLNNYPNPFNNQTIISAQIHKPSRVVLQIYDVLGREVYNTFNEISSAGTINFRWNGVNNDGVELSSGIYFYRLFSNVAGDINQSEIKKLTLLR